MYVLWGRVINIAFAPLYRLKKTYPVANTCQVPFWHSISDVYTFVFGYKTNGMFQ